MRILHVTQGYAPAIGGTELLIQRVSEELVRQFGDEVTVFTTTCYNGEAFFTPSLPRLAAGWEDIAGVRVRRFPVWSRLSRLMRKPQAVAYRLRLPFNDRIRALAGGPIVPGLRAAIRDWPADVVAASSFPLLHMFAALRGAHGSRRPCVLHGGLHPHDRWGFDRPMIDRAIRDAEAYVANTRFEAEYVIRRGASPDRVFAVGVGVDPEIYDGITSAAAKSRAGFDASPLVGFIGQLAGHKGVDTLLRAMPDVWRAEPETNLLLAGGETLFTPDVHRIVRTWPDAWRRRTQVRTNFPQNDKPWLFAAVDVFAYPSGYESFGISFLEAWAAGKPVIGTRNGAIPTVIDQDVDGLLIDYQDAHALTRAILDLLRSPERGREMGAAGRAKVLARYTWPQIAREFRRVYGLALERPPTGSRR
jgi:glycosyltransferase involved in cell wall biosynthesis